MRHGSLIAAAMLLLARCATGTGGTSEDHGMDDGLSVCPQCVELGDGSEIEIPSTLGPEIDVSREAGAEVGPDPFDATADEPEPTMDSGCIPGTVACVEDDVELCGPGGAWEVATSCEHGCSDGQCMECTPGEAQCLFSIATGYQLDICKPGGTWQEKAVDCQFKCVLDRCCVPDCSGKTCGVNDCFELCDKDCDHMAMSGKDSCGPECSGLGEPCERSPTVFGICANTKGYLRCVWPYPTCCEPWCE